MTIRAFPLLTLAVVLAVGIGCNHKNESIANQKQIEDQLQMAGLNNVTIHLEKDSKIATLDGNVNSDQEKATAERIVKATAPKYQMTDNLVVQQQNATNPPASNENGSRNSESAKGKTAKKAKKSASQTASD